MRRVHDDAEFRDFVEHPRFGRGPRYTDVSAVKPGDPTAYTASWRSTRASRVLGTAVAADLTRQALVTMPVLFYFDERRTCIDCGRRFLFFAEEQKYWFEELGFKLDADCIRCWPCRRARQDSGAARARYEELVTADALSHAEQVELLEVGMALLEGGTFGKRVIERMRRLLNELWPKGEELAVRANYVERLS